MFSNFGEDLVVVDTPARTNLKWATRRKESSDNDPVNYNSKKHHARLAFAAFYRAENARLRKPCPTCNNLVQPHLLGQHYDAYHPTLAAPSA